jgi:L-asparaginase II
MPGSPYVPLLELTRGDTVESIHYGAIAIVDADRRLVTQHGDPNAITFLRSTAKPFQALPFIEAGGAEYYDLQPAEIAVICASHSGTDEHVATIIALQAKTGVQQTDLLCGVHEPIDEATAQAMRLRGEAATPDRHNCSGKHTGMLAYARMRGWSIPDYLDPSHPVQENILRTFAAMCDLAPEQVFTGTDGCSAPNFAVPLKNAALAYARLCDPSELPSERAEACRQITTAMTSHPDMVGGPRRFDTLLMEAAQGKIVAKGGAEGYQGLGILPGTLRSGSPAVGIAIKISDGDSKGRARAAVTLETLRQLGALHEDELAQLKNYGPYSPVHNWRDLVVGAAHPSFELERHS